MTTNVTRPCFTTQLQTSKTKIKTTACKTKTKADFLSSQTGLVLRPTVSDHITDIWKMFKLLGTVSSHLISSQRSRSSKTAQKELQLTGQQLTIFTKISNQKMTVFNTQQSHINTMHIPYATIWSFLCWMLTIANCMIHVLLQLNKHRTKSPSFSRSQKQSQYPPSLPVTRSSQNLE